MKPALITICSLLILFFSCKSTTAIVESGISEAMDLPEAFEPKEGLTLDANSCKNPMIDNRDGTEITLVTSTKNQGKYKVPSGKYGLKKGELLLLDCSTGQVIGIVGKK